MSQLMSINVRTTDEAAEIKKATFNITVGNNLKENLELLGNDEDAMEKVNKFFMAAVIVHKQKVARNGLVANDSLETIQQTLDADTLESAPRQGNSLNSIMKLVTSGAITREEAQKRIAAQMDALMAKEEAKEANVEAPADAPDSPQTD